MRAESEGKWIGDKLKRLGKGFLNARKVSRPDNQDIHKGGVRPAASNDANRTVNGNYVGGKSCEVITPLPAGLYEEAGCLPKCRLRTIQRGCHANR